MSGAIAVIDSDGLNPYGACLAEALAEASDGVVYLRRNAPVGRRFGTPFGPMRGGRGTRPARALRLAGGIAGVFRRARQAPAVLIMWETAGDAAMAIALRFLGRPRIVVTLHDPRRRGANHRFARWTFARFGDSIVMHNQLLADEFVRTSGVAPERVVVLPHPNLTGFTTVGDPHSAREQLALPRSAPVVVFFGQIKPYKGIDTLAAAMETVFNAMNGAHLVVAGTLTDLDLGRELMALRDRHPGNVTLVVRSVPLDERLIDEALSAADLVVLPFRAASQSGSVIHALSHGCAVLTTRVGDIIGLADRGFVSAVAPDDPAGLAQAILELLDDPERRSRLAEAGSAYVRRELDPRLIGRRLLETLEPR